MQIPETFLEKAARQFGVDGPAWVQELPTVLARCQEKWRLSDCVPAGNLSINLVCYARSEIHGDVVLKIEGPHSERHTEIMALRLYDGRRACKCLEVEEDAAAVLLERIVPGHDLRSLPDKRTQLAVAAELIAELPLPLDQPYGFATYGDWISRAVATTHERYSPDARMVSLMAEMENRFYGLCPRDAPKFLLHGDLHHDNMLQHRDGEWKAIDPQGVIGPRFLESARFIENHAIDDKGVCLETLDETVAYLAERLGEEKHVIAGATLILHVLSTCWGYEMGYSAAQISQQKEQCEELLQYVRRV
jgi:streptomycin 6-kinase